MLWNWILWYYYTIEFILFAFVSALIETTYPDQIPWRLNEEFTPLIALFWKVPDQISSFESFKFRPGKFKPFIPEQKKRFIDETFFEDFFSNKISAPGHCSIQGIHYFSNERASKKSVSSMKHLFIEITRDKIPSGLLMKLSEPGKAIRKNINSGFWYLKKSFIDETFLLEPRQMWILIEKSKYFKNVMLFSEPLGIEFQLLFSFIIGYFFHIEIFFWTLSVSSTQTGPRVVFAGVQPFIHVFAWTGCDHDETG